MRKSNRGSAFGRRSAGGLFGRRSGTVTVIEEPVRRSATRNAKIVFWVLWVSVSVLAATVLASKWHPIIALIAGAFIGLAVAAVMAAFVLAWPVIRVIWWWAPETAAASGLVAGWVELADHTTLVYRLATVVLIVGIPAAVTPVRRRAVALAWCFVTRHRIRTCFSEFIITNLAGSLPLILWARPTPVGERVWIWLRPGLALDDIQNRLDQIAVACWADAAVVERASDANAAYLRMDIKRRDALTGKIPSPLLGLVDPSAPPTEPAAVPVPSALDLPQVGADEVIPAKPTPISRPDKKTTPAPAPSAVAGNGGTQTSDIEDWI